MTRTVPEWIGKTPDAKIPPRVRLRIFETHWGKCHISGRRIQAGEPWECDHVIALVKRRGTPGNEPSARAARQAPRENERRRCREGDDIPQAREASRHRTQGPPYAWITRQRIEKIDERTGSPALMRGK